MHLVMMGAQEDRARGRLGGLHVGRQPLGEVGQPVRQRIAERRQQDGENPPPSVRRRWLRPSYQRDCKRQARQALGETAFQAAYSRGVELTAEDAIAYALRQRRKERTNKPPGRPPTPAVPAAPAPAAPEPGATPLTPRELQAASSWTSPSPGGATATGRIPGACRYGSATLAGSSCDALPAVTYT